jgi:hypothetical protein
MAEVFLCAVDVLRCADFDAAMLSAKERQSDSQRKERVRRYDR